MKFVQKLGKALMLPVACLPICGILMGLGYAMCPSTMQGGDVTGIVEQIGFFLVKAGGAWKKDQQHLSHSAKSKTHLSVSSPVSSVHFATTDSNQLSFLTGCHSSVVSVV